MFKFVENLRSQKEFILLMYIGSRMLMILCKGFILMRGYIVIMKGYTRIRAVACIIDCVFKFKISISLSKNIYISKGKMFN